MRRQNPLFSVLLLTAFCCGLSTSVLASEKEELAQTIRQLDAAKRSLARAKSQAQTSPRSREYFDYAAAERDIATVQAGISQYINPSRAIPRNPNAMRTLKEDYTKLRAQ